MAVVIGASALAAELAAAAHVDNKVVDVTRETVEGVRDDWMRAIPDSPGGYQGAGFTSSPGANKAEVRTEGPGVIGEVYNQSFVAYFLQRGTSHHGPKVDLLGAAEPHLDRWLDGLGDVVGLE